MNDSHPRPSSPQSTSTNARTTSHSRPLHSPATHAHSKNNSEPVSQRQRRLLQNRNARFPAKKLSLSSLSSRFSQLIHSNDETELRMTPDINQENRPLVVHDAPTHTKHHSSGSSLGILDEITNTNVRRKVRKSVSVAIHEDTSSPERPLLERSPFSSPAGYQDSSIQGVSPIGFDHIQDNLGSMRLREISGNEWRGSPLSSSPWKGSLKAVKQRKSFHVICDSDTQEYIDHIENELQAAKKEIFSPTANKSLKEQLKSIQVENERLNQDMDEMRITLEGEVKRTIEHKAEVEYVLKKKLRNLEEELEQRDAMIKDLELQHDERRLNCSTIDILKSAIERLEQEKLNLEDENRSINKRNEVLSELLAMSPTKMQSFELRSPTRERRPGRPLSLIIPRQPTSPSGRLLSHPPSTNASPSVSSCGPFFGPFKSRAVSPPSSSRGLGIGSTDFDSVSVVSPSDGHNLPEHDSHIKQRSRRSTFQSQGSISDGVSIASKASSPSDVLGPRVQPKRKPRKFMSGSTQLKPLLLSTLTGEVSASSVSTAPSPQDECGSRLPSAISEANEHFPHDRLRMASYASALGSYDSLPHEGSTQGSDRRLYESLADIVAEHEFSQTSVYLPPSAPPSPSPSAFDDTIHDYEIETHCPDVLADTLGTNLYQGAEDYGIDDNIISSPELYGSPSHFPRSLEELDLVALNEIGLPDPDYDNLPSGHQGADGAILTEIPKPLFSFETRRTGTQCDMPLNTNNNEQHSLRSHFTSRDVNEFLPHADGHIEADLAPVKTTKFSAEGQTPPNIVTSDSLPSLRRHRAELPQRSSFRSVQSLDSRRNSLEVLCSSKFVGRPLASFAIRTLFQTISRCTRHVRDFKRDPVALIRRILANAWLSNWKLFGRFSWWVLGLFMSPGFGGPKLKKWEWDNFDVEEIARRACEEQKNRELRFSTKLPQLKALNYDMLSSKHDAGYKEAEQTQRIGWKQSITLWGKFSMAIMLAIGGAVVKGPGEMLKELGDVDKQPLGLGNVHLNGAGSCEVQPEDFGPISYHRYQPTIEDDRLPEIQSKLCELSQHNPSFHVGQPVTIFNCRDDTRSNSRFHAVEDETLKAIRNPRKRVAGYFEWADSPGNLSHQSSVPEQLHGATRNPDITTASRDRAYDGLSRTGSLFDSHKTLNYANTSQLNNTCSAFTLGPTSHIDSDFF